MGLSPSASSTRTLADASLSLAGSRTGWPAASAGTASTATKTRGNRRFIRGSLRTSSLIAWKPPLRQSPLTNKDLYTSDAAQGSRGSRGRCIRLDNGCRRRAVDRRVGRRRRLVSPLVLLEPPHPRVRAVGGQEVCMGAALDDAPVVEHQDLVGI